MTLEGHVASLRPVLESARLTGLDISGWGIARKPLAAAINGLLSRYIDNVNGAIEPLTYAIDPADLGLTGTPLAVDVGRGRTVTLPGVTLGATAALLNSSGLHLIGELEAGEVDATALAVPAAPNFAAYQEMFWAKAAPVRSGPSRSDPGIFLSGTILHHVLAGTFAPVELSELQQIALSNVLESLREPGILAAGAFIRVDMLVPAAEAAITKALADLDNAHFGPPVLKLGDQIIQLTAPVTGAIEAAKLAFAGTVSVAGIVAPKDGRLYCRFALAALKLDRVEHLGGPVSVQPFVGSLSELLAQLIPYVNAAVDDVPIDIPLPEFEPIPLKAENVTIVPDKLQPVQLGQITAIPRVTEAGVQLMVFESPGVASGSVQSSFDVDRNFSTSMSLDAEASDAPIDTVEPSTVDQAFSDRWSTALPALAPAEEKRSIVLAVSTGWAMSTVSRTLEANDIRATTTFDTGKIPYDTGKIRLAEDLKPACHADKKCSRKGCSMRSCSRDSCNYRCTRCVRVFGKKLCADEPGCKAAETACNLREETKRGACNIQANAEKAACDTREEAALAACNTQRNLEILGCNVVNEVIRAIRQIDGIGRADGHSQVRGAAQLSTPRFDYDPASGKASLEIGASAHVDVQGKIHFVPYDIGHLLVCPIPGTIPFAVNATLPAGRQVVSAHLRKAAEQQPDGLRIEVVFDPLRVRGNISPAPVDALLTQNPQVVVTCSPVLTGALASASVVGKVSAFTPMDILKAMERAVPGNQEKLQRDVLTFTTGIVDREVEIPSMALDVPELKPTVAGVGLALVPEWTGTALIYAQR